MVIGPVTFPAAGPYSCPTLVQPLVSARLSPECHHEQHCAETGLFPQRRSAFQGRVPLSPGCSMSAPGSCALGVPCTLAQSVPEALIIDQAAVLCCLEPLPTCSVTRAIAGGAQGFHCRCPANPSAPTSNRVEGRQLGKFVGVYSTPDIKEIVPALFWGEQQVPKSVRSAEGANFVVFREHVYFNLRDKQQCSQTQLSPGIFSSFPGCPALLCSCQSLPRMKPLGLNSLSISIWQSVLSFCALLSPQMIC